MAGRIAGRAMAWTPAWTATAAAAAAAAAGVGRGPLLAGRTAGAAAAWTTAAAWLRRPGSAPERVRDAASRSQLAPAAGCSIGQGVEGRQGIGGVRHTEGVRLVQTSPGLIVDKFVPIPRSAMPSLFSRVGLALRWANVKGLVRSTVSVARLRQRLPGWKPIPFAEEVEKMFQDMNKAFATYVPLASRRKSDGDGERTLAAARERWRRERACA